MCTSQPVRDMAIQQFNSKYRPNSARPTYGNKSVDEIETDLRAHFAVQYRNFNFERVIGCGAFGLVFSVIEKIPGNRTRRLAVKRSLVPQEEDDLRNEIQWLQRLRGAEHIVRMLAYRDDPEPRVLPRNARTASQRRRRALQDSLAGLVGPVVVLEYLENGNLAQVFNGRLIKHDQLLPNRVLWSFFLCMTRACVALAYPLNGAGDQPNQLETLPVDGREPSRVEHADLHMGNIMIGHAGDEFQEHDLVPALKFIDFGRTREGFDGVVDNLWTISRTMINLIARQEVRISRWITTYQGIETRATEILPHGNGSKYPTLDNDLRDFLARCLADEKKDRPSLQTMLRTTENAVRNKTGDTFNNGNETNEMVKNILQQYIYNAEIE
ncbi:kinase-like domain-containing protein [Hypoxylon sp. NC1633]|nr:kinase-like domain-containing protein [Hypoxylon sp. NC1633]